MRIVIAGAGKLGFSIAQLLAEDQFDVVVVEIDPKRNRCPYPQRGLCYPFAGNA